MFSLNEQEETINHFLDVIEVNDKIREMKLDINIAFKHSILPENINGQIKEFDDNTVLENLVS